MSQSRRLLSFFLTLTLLVVCAPAHATQRAALVIADEAGGAAASIAEALSQGYGFEVIRSSAKTLADLQRDVASFGEVSKGAELSFLFISTGMEHDENGTFILPSTSAPNAKGGVSLSDLLATTVNNSRVSVAFLEVADRAPESRRPGVGRLPAIPNRLLISVSDVFGPRTRSAPVLATALGTASDPRVELVPASLANTVRERIYLDTSGLQVPRSLGGLPDSTKFDRAPERAGVLTQLRTRIKELCTSEYAKSPTQTERTVLSSAGLASRRSPTGGLEDIDVFSLEKLLLDLGKATACPTLTPTAVVVPPGAAPTVPAPAAPGSKSPDAPVPAKGSPPTTPPPATPPAASPPPAPPVAKTQPQPQQRPVAAPSQAPRQNTAPPRPGGGGVNVPSF